MQIIIETSDIERIQQLASKCYMDAYKEIHSEEQNRFSFGEMYSTSSLRQQFDELHSRYYILCEDDIDVGYAATYPIAKGRWMLDKLYILPDKKKHGYGHILLEHIIQKIREAEGASFQILLKVNRRNPAVEFYKHFGFKIINSWDIAIADGKWTMDGYDMELNFRNI